MHSFAKLAPHRAELLQSNKLKDFVKMARKLSETKEGIKAYETGHYKDMLNTDGSVIAGSWSPHYFGGAIEFLAETYFEVFGAEYNMIDVASVEDFDNNGQDTGVDHYAVSLRNQAFGRNSNRAAKAMAPVFIQTKGTLDARKEFKTNDGARLPNFYMNAFSQARKGGHAYSARFILFTTGKGIHYILDDNSGNCTEVVAFKEISKHVDDNVVFWNALRKKAKVKIQKYTAPSDAEAVLNVQTNNYLADQAS